ncbi:MAG: hypothetical protein SFV52_10665 [Saprospiraceae bacterium]|nr:hypothetical protein [Saprospiraceae bacterium]
MKTHFFSLLLLCLSIGLRAQDTPPADSLETVVINMLDGNEMVGQLVRQDAQTLTLRTKDYGDVILRKDQIKSISEGDSRRLVDGVYWQDNVYATRYLFGPSAYNLRKGEGYYQNTWIFINQFSVGVTNHFTIGAGLIPLFFFAGTPSPVWITPKVSLPIQSEIFNASLGALAGTVVGEEESGFGVLYGNTTFGPRDRNLTLGLGYGFAGGELADVPTVTIGGTYRVGPKLALLTENYFLDAGDSNYFLGSFGLRFILRDVAIDGALIIPTETGGSLFFIPWLGLTVPFGRRKK